MNFCSKFSCEKKPLIAAGGMVVTNAPLGSLAATGILAEGGNAVDAAVAALLVLTVVEPMMVGIAGGGISHIRLADGRHIVIDALSSAGRNMHSSMFRPVSDLPDRYMEAEGRLNMIGGMAVAVPGNLAGWHMMQQKYGRLPFSDVVEPAIQAASRGFEVSDYLHGAIAENRDDLLLDPHMARMFLPDGLPAPVGSRIVMEDYARSLRLIASQGAKALNGGELGAALIDHISQGAEASLLTLADLADYRAIEREPIIGTYRGYEIAGPPPPASSGVHIVQMLNMLEYFDLQKMGFGSFAATALLERVMAAGFRDRNAASGDPEFVSVPVEKFTSKAYAKKLVDELPDFGAASFMADRAESNDTTHLTIADRDGNIVSATHTINGLFGAKIMVPETGIIPNNYMMNYDPRPGKAMSVEPGKRVPTSMAPMIISRDGRPAFALGLPGGVRIFPSAMQAIVNLLDHGMDVQHAVEAPRIWTAGHHVELEPAYAQLAEAFRAAGKEVRLPKTIGGGMGAIAFGNDGFMTGAACWRADGTVMGIGGGLARPGVRFVL